nr:molybdopterin-binding protein [Hankyongella ginsenosidimutans]
MQPALTRAGAEIGFWRIAMRPGKPLMAARLGSAIALGLPGNPVSAFVTAQLFLLPLLRPAGCRSTLTRAGRRLHHGCLAREWHPRRLSARLP